MTDKKEGKRALVLGFSGSGKTNLVRGLLAASSSANRVVAFDPDMQFDRGWHVVEGNFSEFKDVLRAAWLGEFKIAYVPNGYSEEEELHELTTFIAHLQKPYIKGNLDKKIMVVVDELQLSFPKMPKKSARGFADICRQGRKRGIDVIAISQSPADVGMSLRRNLDRIMTFQFSEGNDVDAAVRLLGGRTDAREALNGLGQWEYIDYAINQGFKVKKSALTL